MCRLIVQTGSPAGRQINFNRGQQHFLLLGRGEECDLRFTEIGVSLCHAIIGFENGQLSVQDQGSFNGTFVNGIRIESALLRGGDVIELGPGGPRLQVSIDEIAATQDLIHFISPFIQDRQISPLYQPPNARGIFRHAADNIGLYDPVHDSGRPTESVSVVFILIILAVFGLMVGGLMWLNLGIKVALLSSIIAFVPAALYLSVFLWLDRFDPEPPGTLAFAFAWGATISIFFSGIVNDIFGATLGDTLTSILTAPIIEEACKGIGVLLIALLFRKDFDSLVDGIVYAGVVALGFSTMENVDYYGRSLAQGGLGGLAGTFFIRGILAPFSHVLFTCMTGIGFGVSRETHNQTLKTAAPLIGCFGAMFLHSLWNTLASFDGRTFITGYFLLEVPLFSGFILIIAYLVRREGRILKQTLAAEVNRGLITQQQLEIAISVFRRTSWVASAFGNSTLFNTRRRFLRSVAKLGLCRWHQARAPEAMKDTGSFRMISQLQAEVFELRDRVG